MAEMIKDALTSSGSTSGRLSLPPDLAVIAARELNETPQLRRQALTEFRRALNEEEARDEEVSAPEDDSILLRFLRCKKFDVSRSLSVYNGYKAFRKNNKELFNDLTPSRVSHIWDNGLLGALESRDKHGRAVMVSFPGSWDPETQPLEDVLRAMILQLEHLIEDKTTQVTGIVLIADFKDFSLYQAKCIRPWFFQGMSSLVQNAFPARFKGVYILHQPWYISLIMAVVSRLLTEKMNSRIHMLGDDLNELSNDFNLETLPEEFGGQGEPYNGHHWTDVMTSKENEGITPNDDEKDTKDSPSRIECTAPQPNKLRLETEI